MAVRRDHLALVLLLAIFAVAGAVVLLYPSGVRARLEDQQCRLRLRRMGQALNAWVLDHGRRQYPAIVNPAPAVPWEPGRAAAAEAVLWEYLHGDIPPRPRAGESERAYHQRLREAQLAVCPVTEFPYWYNQDLMAVEPSAVATNALEEIAYFQCQRGVDGEWPHRVDGAEGIHTVFGQGIQQQVTGAEVEALAERIAELAAADAEHPDLPRLRAQLADLRRGLERGDGFTVSVRLTEEVRFVPRE